MAFVTARAESPNSGSRCARSVGRCVILRTALVILHHDVPCFLVQETHTIGDALEDSRQDQAPTHNWAIATSTFMMAPRLSPPPAPASTRRRGGGETEATLTLGSERASVAVQVTRQSTPRGGAARRQLARTRSAGTSGARAVLCSPRQRSRLAGARVNEVVWRVPASTKSSGGCPRQRSRLAGARTVGGHRTTRWAVRWRYRSTFRRELGSRSKQVKRPHATKKKSAVQASYVKLKGLRGFDAYAVQSPSDNQWG
jgi:hypothetical protein